MNPGVCARDGCETSLRFKRADAKWCSDACAIAQKRADRANTAPTRRRSGGPSGLQVSYRKAVEACTAVLVEWDVRVYAAPQIAEKAMREALSERQRERLEARGR